MTSHLHDTYFVVAHFHIVMGVAAFFGMFAGIYHWFPRMFGRFMNETLGKLHFWGTMIGAYMIFWPMHYLGMAGVPRRYARFDSFQAFGEFAALNQFITIGAIITFAFQLLFVINFFYSIWTEARRQDEDAIHGVLPLWNGPAPDQCWARQLAWR